MQVAANLEPLTSNRPNNNYDSRTSTTTGNARNRELRYKCDKCGMWANRGDHKCKENDIRTHLRNKAQYEKKRVQMAQEEESEEDAEVTVQQQEEANSDVEAPASESDF